MSHQDLYEEILDIPQGERPPNYYQLLLIGLFESDGNVIHSAGLEQFKKLKEWQLHPDPKIRETVLQMLNQVCRASSSLEVPKKKEEYDQYLAQKLNINIAENTTYHVLDVQPELLQCPNCGEEQSTNAVICIDCGYNFNTGQVLKTHILENYDDEPNLGINISIKGHTLKECFSPLRIAKYILVTLVLFSALFIWRNFHLFSPNFVLEGEYINQRKWEKFINDSTLWQDYFHLQRLNPEIKRPYIRLLEYFKGT